MVDFFDSTDLSSPVSLVDFTKDQFDTAWNQRSEDSGSLWNESNSPFRVNPSPTSSLDSLGSPFELEHGLTYLDTDSLFDFDEDLQCLEAVNPDNILETADHCYSTKAQKCEVSDIAVPKRVLRFRGKVGPADNQQNIDNNSTESTMQPAKHPNKKSSIVKIGEKIVHRPREYQSRKRKAYDEPPQKDPDAERSRKNAITARLNREKKKRYIFDLENQVSDLTTINEELRERNDALNDKVDELSSAVQELKSLLQNHSPLSGLLNSIKQEKSS